MSPQVSLTKFHHWLLESHRSEEEQPKVLLLGDAQDYPHLARDIVAHLNQYDDIGSGKWMAFSPPLLESLLADPCQLKLLNVQPPCEKCGIGSACGMRKLLAAIAQHGNAVIESPQAIAATKDMKQVFRVSLANPKGAWHVRMEPGLFPKSCLAPIIGDVYLEWIHCSCDH